MSHFLEYDEDIFQEMVRFYGRTFGIPPIASKIYSYLIFDFEKRGVPFDELIEFFGFSKSSVSESIHLLKDLQLLVYTTKEEDRKKYFLTNPDFSKMRFTTILNRLLDEKKLLEKLNLFKRGSSSENRSKEYSLEYLAYKEFLDKGIKNFEEILQKLSTTYEN